MTLTMVLVSACKTNNNNVLSIYHASVVVVVVVDINVTNIFFFLFHTLYSIQFIYKWILGFRARFRNQNRSIFVNPQNLKVAQAQERRLSQLSQLSANGLRTPRTTPSRSPNNSCSRSARSSYGSNVYSLNDPATINVTQHLCRFFLFCIQIM